MKQESAATGGDPLDAGGFDAATPIDATEDSMACAGIFGNEPDGGGGEDTDKTVHIWREGSEWWFKDSLNSATSLSTLNAAGSDEKASVSNNDTTPGFLNGKLVAGNGVQFTEQNDGANETLEIEVGHRRHFLLMGG